MNLRKNQVSRQKSGCQYCNQSSPKLIKKMQQNLQDLLQQVQLLNNKNIQLTKLVQIITNERNYYSEQLNKSDLLKQHLEDQLRKQKIEADSKTILINQLKKANRQLSEQVQNLSDNLEQTKFLFQAQQQQIQRIRKEKQLIETEWSRVIKQVNNKMSRIQKKQEQDQKQNMEMFCNLPLKQKVKKALNKIDRELKEQQLLGKKVKNMGMQWKMLKESPKNSTSGNEYIEYDLESDV